MKKIYISTVTAAILSTGVFAESNSIKEAFENGKASGDISIYTRSVSKSGANKDSGYTVGSIGISYETDSFNGFKGSLAAKSNHKLTEKEKGDFSNGADPEAALSTANISYTIDNATIIAGRQEIDLEWIGDFHEAVVGVSTHIPDTTIVAAHTSRFMAVDSDGELEKMADIGEHGASVIDVKYEGIKGTTINPYFMNASDLFSAYGLKATTSIANIDFTAHYAATNEDALNTEDGSIAHLEVGTTLDNIGFVAGYITTDKDGGIGSLDTLGENIAPTKDIDSSVYAVDSDSFYAKVSADISSVSLSAQYTTSKHGNDTDSEILVKAGTSIADNLEIDFLYAGATYENSDSDTDKVTLMATYSF